MLAIVCEERFGDFWKALKIYNQKSVLQYAANVLLCFPSFFKTNIGDQNHCYHFYKI